jgi:cation transport ATPase
MEVMRESESQATAAARLGDQLGAIYTPVALVVAVLAWVISGESFRFLAVLVIATPCPLLLAIPIAIIGSISLCARRAIIVKSPVVLEQIAGCRTAIFDKTGTLTYGEPALTEQLIAPGFDARRSAHTGCQPGALFQASAGSRHPDRRGRRSACTLPKPPRSASSPARGLRWHRVRSSTVQITSRNKLIEENLPGTDQLPPVAGWTRMRGGRSTSATPPRCAFAMRRAPKAAAFVIITSGRSITSTAS